MEATGGQTRGRDWTKKVDARAVSVEGLSGSVAGEEEQPRPEFGGLFKYGGQLRVGRGLMQGAVGN